MRLIGSRAYTRPVQVPKMPVDLVELMEGLTRDVLKNNPPDIYEFCADHMHKLLEIRDGPTKKVTLTLEQKIARAQIKVKQKADARYQKYLKEVQNSNTGKSNIKTETRPDSQKTSTASPTPPLQHMLKPPVYQDLNLSNASEIEISHQSGDVTSSASSNIHNKTEATGNVTSENISKEKVSKTSFTDIGKDVTILNKMIICDKKGETDDYFSSSENFNNLRSKSENVVIEINETQAATVQVSNNDALKDLTSVEDSADCKISANAQSSVDYNEEEVAETNVNFNYESSGEKTKNEIDFISLPKEDNKEMISDITKTVENNVKRNTEMNRENIINSNDNNHTALAEIDDDSAANKEVINEYANQTHLQEPNSMDLKEFKIEEEIIKIENESNVENIHEMDNFVRTDIADELKNEHLRKEQIDESTVQPHADKSDENLLLSDDVETRFAGMEYNTIDAKQNEVQENNLVRSIKDLTNDKLPEETENSEFHIVNNILLKENENNIPTKEILLLNNTFDNVNNSQSEINSGEKTTNQLDNDTIRKEFLNENTSEVNRIEEPESRIVSKADIHNNQSIETSQKLSIEELELKRNIELVSSCDISSETNVTKNNENKELMEETTTANTEKNLMNLKTDINEQHEDELELTSLTEKNIMSLKNEENELYRAKIDISEPGHIDENIFSKKSISGDESTDGNDNTSFVESGASETLDDTSQRTNPNSNTMDLETAAVTIQKVFRTFLFKSRASTFDDTNDENMPLDDENDKKEEIEFQASNVTVGKERRGISRMDTVLQTVNEEKSLSLSTDDSSTLSSAATTIQAHVRGFLVRNRLHSHKTASTNSLVNSDGPSNTSLDGDTELNKSKTILNIHIVPEGGNYLSREESMLTSIELSLDSPPSFNLHPLGYDRNERRKQLKREDAIQSISPPSNNSGKLSEDVDSVKDLIITDSEAVNQKNLNANRLTNSDNTQLLPESGDTSPTNSTTIETVVEAHRVVDLESPDPKMKEQVNNTKRTLTKMSSDEMDVVTPFEDNEENEPSKEMHNAKLMHSGEFHDIVLPTKVSRKDTSVVSEFKNVLVYFLLWNNS